MFRQLAPCVFRGLACSSTSGLSRIPVMSSFSVTSSGCRVFSTDIDFSHEKPAPEQLEHVQKRLMFTVPLMFRQRLDYTFYHRDVFCDDQIFRLQRKGRDQLMQHFGTIGSLGQFLFPHIEMEVMSVVPMMEDGTVRCRWRVKYVSFFRLFTNFRLFRREYRLQNLSWFDGYSIFTVDGNGQVFKVTLQTTRSDDSKLLNEKTAKQKLAEKIAVFRPSPSPQASAHFASRHREDEDGDRKRGQGRE